MDQYGTWVRDLGNKSLPHSTKETAVGQAHTQLVDQKIHEDYRSSILIILWTVKSVILKYLRGFPRGRTPATRCHYLRQGRNPQNQYNPARRTLYLRIHKVKSHLAG